MPADFHIHLQKAFSEAVIKILQEAWQWFKSDHIPMKKFLAQNPTVTIQPFLMGSVARHEATVYSDVESVTLVSQSTQETIQYVHLL